MPDAFAKLQISAQPLIGLLICASILLGGQEGCSPELTVLATRGAHSGGADPRGASGATGGSPQDGPSGGTLGTADSESGGAADSPSDFSGGSSAGGGSSLECWTDQDCPYRSWCSDGSCSPCPGSSPPPCDPGFIPLGRPTNGCNVPDCIPGGPCSHHSDCPKNTLCGSDGHCTSCGPQPKTCDGTCPDGWRMRPLDINGCHECGCMRTSACYSDEQCSMGLHCYAGLDCQPGCVGDASCCEGNFCGMPSCPEMALIPRSEVFCSSIGCPTGLRCDDPCNAGPALCDIRSGLWFFPPACGTCSLP